ncbi:MAG: hypothetical protein Q8S33_13165 [Myxococcales bacterium]|nr:hypothetical protein [Myxococcales bacterium]
MNPHLKTIAPLFGKRARALDDQPVILFDWATIPEKRRESFLDELFGDGGSVGAHVPFGLMGVEDSPSWKFNGGTTYPQFNRLLLLEEKTGAVFGIDVDGTASSTAKRMAKSLEQLEFGRFEAPPGRPTGKLDPTAYRRVHLAVLTLSKGLFQLAAWTASNKPAKAKAARATCDKGLEQLSATIESTPAFATHAGISKMPALYARAIAKKQWKGKTIKFSTANERFFSEKPFRPLASYDAWVATWVK